MKHKRYMLGPQGTLPAHSRKNSQTINPSPNNQGRIRQGSPTSLETQPPTSSTRNQNSARSALPESFTLSSSTTRPTDPLLLSVFFSFFFVFFFREIHCFYLQRHSKHYIQITATTKVTAARHNECPHPCPMTTDTYLEDVCDCLLC